MKTDEKSMGLTMRANKEKMEKEKIAVEELILGGTEIYINDHFDC